MSISGSGSLAAGSVPLTHSGTQIGWGCYDATILTFPTMYWVRGMGHRDRWSSSCIHLHGSNKHTFICSYFCSVTISFSLVGREMWPSYTWNSKETQNWWLWVLSITIGRIGEADRWDKVTTVMEAGLEAGLQNVGQHAKVRGTLHVVNWGFAWVKIRKETQVRRKVLLYSSGEELWLGAGAGVMISHHQIVRYLKSWKYREAHRRSMSKE